MDGELLGVLVMIGIGVLSSLFGDKKKGKQKRQRIRQQQRGIEAPDGEGASLDEPQAKASAARRDVASAMEEILKELQLGPQARVKEAPTRPPPPPVAERPEPRPAPSRSERERPTPKRPERPRPAPRTPPPPRVFERPVPATEIPSTPEAAPLSAETHSEFHEEFIKPLKRPKRKKQVARARRLMTRNGLRDAILAHEIFGPPKGMQ